MPYATLDKNIELKNPKQKLLSP